MRHLQCYEHASKNWFFSSENIFLAYDQDIPFETIPSRNWKKKNWKRCAKNELVEIGIIFHIS